MHETTQLYEQIMQTKIDYFLRTKIMQIESSQRSKQILQPYQRKNLTRFVCPWQKMSIFLLCTMSVDREHQSLYRLLILQRRVLKTLQVVAKILFALKTRVKREKKSKFSSLYSCCLRVCLQLLNQSIHTKEYKNLLICVLTVLSVIEREFKTSQQYISLLSSIIKLSRYFVVRATLHNFDIDLFVLFFLLFANNSNTLKFLFVFDSK